MPGLSFLSKKSWHTSNIDNVERVWLAEQKAEAEKKKLDELQKQLNEERQIQELRQLQVESGQKVKTVDTTLDWMYQGPSADLQKQQSSEEYLLGKIFKPKQEVNIDFNKKDNVSDATWMNKVASKNDSFTRVHEDPILLIKQEEKRKRDLVMNNPLKMDKIRLKISQELEKAEEEKRLKKQMKKEKKEHKKESKKSKKRARSDSESEDSNKSLSPPRRRHEESLSPERNTRDRSRSRDRNNRRDDSNSRDRKIDRRDSRDYDRHRDFDRDRGRDNRDRDRDRDRGDRYTNERRRADSRSRDYSNNNRRRRNDSRSPERRPHHSDPRDDRRNNQSPDRANTHSKVPDSSSSSSSMVHNESKTHRDTEVNKHTSSKDDRSDSEDSTHRSSAGPVKYGLISKNNRSSKPLDDKSLGPSATLLQKKADKDRLEQEQRHRHRTDISALSAEERARRIAEMQKDADANEASRSTRMTAFANKESNEAQNSGNAEFLSSMRKTVYTSSSSNMGEHLNQNKHYVQSNSNMESDNGFKKK